MTFTLNITAESVETQKPTLGGSKFLTDSGSQKAEIKEAYLKDTKNGGKMLNLTLATEDGTTVKLQTYILRQVSPGVMDNKPEGGDKPYFGYRQMDEMAQVVTGQQLHTFVANTEQKYVEMYNADAGKAIPTPVNMIMPLVGKSVIGGFIKQIEDKTKLNQATGTYDPTGETREVNIVDQWFNATTRLTAYEQKHGATPELFIEAWDAKNRGVTRNRAKGASSQSGSPVAAQAAPAVSW